MVAKVPSPAGVSARRRVVAGTSPSPSRRRWFAAAAVVGVGLVVLLGLLARLDDPLSSPVVPAEDPYNHMALVREHVRSGELDPLGPTQDLYPPGLHAVLAAAWSYTGVDLYDLVRFGPAVLGAAGVLGMAVLLWRTAGPVAGFVGALALAVAPEAIFRTAMMSPTALDLAILPAFLLALLRSAEGRLGWLAPAGVTAAFFAFAHPWLLAILCAAGIAFLALGLLLPAASRTQHPLSAPGVTGCIAVLGGGLAIALTMPGFEGIVDVPGGLPPVALGLAVATLSFTPLAGLLTARRLGHDLPMGWSAWSPGGPRRTFAIRALCSAILGAALVATALAASARGMPAFVDLPRMFGWPLLALAAAGLVALPFAATRVARLGAALGLATLPFVVFNPFSSGFLPHRTAVFLGIALAALAGVAAAALVSALAALGRRIASARATPQGANAARRPHRSAWIAAAPALLVCTLLGGSIFAGTPEAYPGGWYRLYTPCELDGLRDVAAQANADPDAILVTGDWQAKLVLAGLTTGADRVWFKADVFTSQPVRDELVAIMAKEGRPLIVVTDRYLATETPGADTGFTQSPPWQPAGTWCAGMGVAQPRLQAYTAGGAA